MAGNWGAGHLDRFARTANLEGLAPLLLELPNFTKPILLVEGAPIFSRRPRGCVGWKLKQRERHQFSSNSSGIDVNCHTYGCFCDIVGVWHSPRRVTILLRPKAQGAGYS